jgi:hypothetical protein
MPQHEHRARPSESPRRRFVCATLGGILSIAPRAGAQSTGDPAIAQAIFEQGRTLMGAGRYDEACDKFRESHRLDPASGTLLNLAVCHEKQHKTATAWAEYNDVVASARREANAERQRIASERIRELEPKLCRLTIVSVSDASRTLSVKVDGIALGAAAMGTAVPLDPGTHVVEIVNSTKLLWTGPITLATEGSTSTITVVDLEPTAAQPAVADPNARTRLAYVFGATGAAALGLGIFFGLRAKAEWDERNEHCPGGACDARAVTAAAGARDLALAADVGFGLGVLGLGFATYFALSPRTKAPASGHQLGIRAGSGAMVSAGGVF